MAIMRFSYIFHQVCVKVWNPFDIVNLQKNVVVTFSLLKKIPLAFFDIMTHFLLHVVDELDIYGPIHIR
jgi:hypothetical protein